PTHFPSLCSLCLLLYLATTDLYTLSLHDALPILSFFQHVLDERLDNVEATSRIEVEFPGAFAIRWCNFVFDAFCAYVLTDLLFTDRKSTRLNSSHVSISYAVFCLKKKILQTIYRI